MISDIEAFIRYFHGQRRRTQWMVDAVPPEKFDWQPWPDEFSPSDLVCRLAATHLMYATVVAHNYWEVDDYESATVSWKAAQAYFHAKTERALDLLRALPNSALYEKRHKPNANIQMTSWRFLMAMLDTEIHHRAQLSDYLMLLNVRRPRMDAVSIEAVRAAIEAK